MKTKKILSFFLSCAIIFTLFTFTASADNTNITQGNDILTTGYEDENFRYNIIVDVANDTCQFAIVYLDSPDYVYEFVFDVSIFEKPNSKIDLSRIKDFCFENQSKWNEIYLPDAVTIVEGNENTQFTTSSYSPSSAEAYFNDWLIQRYEVPYYGRVLGSKTINGTTMYLKCGFQVDSDRSTTYRIAQTITVAGFVTSVLGIVTGGVTLISVLSTIASAGGLFTMGQSVYEYELRADWYRYATLVNGPGYPYGMCDKFITYTGYSYSETGSCNVDSASAKTTYAPSSSVFNSYTQIYNRAYDEYDRIGWQDGIY